MTGVQTCALPICPPTRGNDDNGWLEVLKEKQLRIHVTMELPEAPAQEYQALAVADYVAAGKIYPFTLS